MVSIKYPFIVPTIIALGITTIFPFAYLIWLSVNSEAVGGVAREFIGLGNYGYLFRDDEFWNGIYVTGIFVVAAVSVEIIGGLGISILLNRVRIGKEIYRVVLLLPMIVAPVIAGLMFKLMMNPTLGFFNYVLMYWFKLPGSGWYSDASMALPSVILIDIWLYLPFTILIFTAGLEALPREPYEAADLDGANPIQAFRYITLPLLRPLFLVAIVFRTMDAIKVFGPILATSGGGPGIATQTMSIFMFVEAFQKMNFGYSAAISVVTMLVILVISYSYSRVIRFER